MVQEHRSEYPSLWATIESIAPKIGCVPQPLNEWVRKYETDSGLRDGVTSEERDRIKALKREIKELREANEILSWPALFFAQAELSHFKCHARPIPSLNENHATASPGCRGEVSNP